MVLRNTICLRKAAQGRSDLVAFQRFVSNRRVTVWEIIASAAERTRAACEGRDILLIQDTTELNAEAKSGRKRGLGTVGNGTDIGLFAHPALAVDAQSGAVLGLAGATIWCRFGKKAANYQDRPIETKESHRWISTIQAAKAGLRARSITVVADREADIYEMLARLPDERTHILVRSMHDRALARPRKRASDGDPATVWAAVATRPQAGQIVIDLPARPGRRARRATLALRFDRVTIRQPTRGADPRDPRQLPVTAVEAREIGAPDGAEPIVWQVLTSRPVETVDEAVQTVEAYRKRWTIEQLFRTLKSQAIDLEDSVVKDQDSLQRLTAMALVAATTVMQLVHARGPAGAVLPAAYVFSPDDLQVMAALIPTLEGKTTKQKNPHPPGSLAWAGWSVARLGGWTGYASERPPGPITFHNGLRRFRAMADGFALAKLLGHNHG